MSWKCCHHLKKQENLFYHLLPGGKVCFPPLSVFDSTQLCAHPANVIYRSFNINFCFSLKYHFKSSFYRLTVFVRKIF